jgi:exo-1,4-beta-D-glucosaminidase
MSSSHKDNFMRRTLLLLLCSVPLFAQSDTKHFLRSGWQIESGCKATETGDVLSTTSYKPKGWLPATVPTTVLAAQVAAGLYPDPYFGMNLRNIPGNNSHPITKMFANLPMPADSPYACPWWYRTEFTLPAAFRGKQVWLHFGGVNFRANVWVNGKQIANSNDMAGMWREWEFNITPQLANGANVLAVQVYAQKENDLGITFVDWNPMPPDKDMGLYRPVYLTTSGPVAVRHPFVSAKLDPDLKKAVLEATVELTNTSASPVTGYAEYRVDLHSLYAEAHADEAARLRRQGEARVKAGFKPLEIDNGTAAISGGGDVVTLAPGESKTVSLAALDLDTPRTWWPYGMGAQDMYEANFRFLSKESVDSTAPSPRVPKGYSVSDEQTIRFAIRSVTSELTPEGYRLFKVNGKNFLVRGAGWTPDMMLRQTPQRLQAEMNYARDMHLNTLRLEGKLETDEFFDLADRMGIMIMAGWCCCDHWEHWKDWKPEDYTISAASLADEIRRLRNHPSLLVWLNGSDNPPPPDVEQKYIDVLHQYNWPNPYISSATAKPTTVTGASGVKMTGPYEWVPPMYWTADKSEHGGAWGFNTETSPGAAIPVAESIRHMLPQPSWWPQDDVWNYHAGLGNFKNLDIYNASLAARYGKAANLEQYVWQSQAAAYDGQRAMFEAYIRNRYTSTGVIQWMYNNAWPGTIWHLYDYFLVPGGGYFGTKKANEPLHVLYGYDDRSVRVSNLDRQGVSGLRVSARVLNFDMTEKFARSVTIDAAPDSVVSALEIPVLDGLTSTYFLDLRVADASGRALSRNFYWLSTKPDVLDWPNTKFFYTPLAQSGDFTQLSSLPKVKVRATRVAPGDSHVAPGVPAPRPEPETSGERLAISVTNPTKSLAFQVRVRVTDGANGDEIVPVRWDDNYFSLLPAGSQTVTARFEPGALAGKHPVVHVDGWNVEPATVR